MATDLSLGCHTSSADVHARQWHRQPSVCFEGLTFGHGVIFDWTEELKPLLPVVHRIGTPGRKKLAFGSPADLDPDGGLGAFRRLVAVNVSLHLCAPISLVSDLLKDLFHSRRPNCH